MTEMQRQVAALQGTTQLRFLDTPLGACKAFINAAALGMAVTELSRVLKQGFERFSILGHQRPTRRAPVGLSEAGASADQVRKIRGAPGNGSSPG